MNRPQFIIFIEPGRPEMPDAPTSDEIRIVGEHFAYLRAAHERGEIILVGRTQNAPFIGIAVFEADDLSAAEEFIRKDPGVKSGVFRLTSVQPYSVALMRGIP